MSRASTAALLLGVAVAVSSPARAQDEAGEPPAEAPPPELTPELDGEPADASPSETPPADAPPPEPLDPTFDEVTTLLDVEQEVWDLDDGLGEDEVPWDDYDPETEYVPRGDLHVGAQLRVAGLPGGAEPLSDGPLVELGVFGDLRYARTSPWHLRAVLAVAFQPQYEEPFVSTGIFRYASIMAIKLRLLPVAVDLGNWGAIRVGPELGVQLVPRPDAEGDVDTFGAAEVLGAGTAELVIRLFDGLLEVGVVVGMQLTGIFEVSRANPRGGTRVEPEAVLGGQVGGILP